MGRHSENRSSQIQVRFSAELHEKIRVAAANNSRPINSEIVHRLETSFEPSRQLAPLIDQFINEAIEEGVKARLKAIASQIGGA